MSAPDTTALLSELTDVVAGIREQLDVVADHARRTARPELARSVRALGEQMDSAAAAFVVVAGEPCSGKSYLLNALVERPGLLPVDADVSTGVHVVLRYGPERAQVYLGDRELPTDVTLDMLADYVSVHGNPGNVKDVAYVCVDVPAEVLGHGLHLVDTPGVGGLDAAHGRRTLAALGNADALVFVLDPRAPLSRPELDFLTRAAERIDAVLLVLTKTDNHPHWETVLAENRRLIAEHAPGLAHAQILPLSAKQAIASSSASDPSTRDRRRRQSRIDSLSYWLTQEVAERRRRLRIRRATRAGLSAADQLLIGYDAMLAALAEDRGTSAFETEQRRLADLRRAASSWRPQLRTDLQDVQRDSANRLTEALGALRTRLDADLARDWTRDRHQQLPEDLRNELTAVELELGADLTRRIGEVAARCGAELGIESIEVPVVRPSPQPASVPGPAIAPPTDWLAAVRVLLNVGVIFAGNPTNPVTILQALVSLTKAPAELGSLRRSRDQQEARRYLGDAVTAWQSRFAEAVRETLSAAQDSLEDSFGRVLEERLESLVAQLAELREVAEDRARQQRRRDDFLESRATLAAARAELAQSLDAVTGRAT